MEKIFTRYVVTLALVASLSCHFGTLLADDVLFNQDFSSFEGHVNSTEIDGWTMKEWGFVNNALHNKAIYLTNGNSGRGYLTSPKFGKVCNSILTFRYTNYSSKKSNFSVSISGSAKFEDGSDVAPYDLRNVSNTTYEQATLKIFGATSDTQVTFSLNSDNSFVIDDVKVTASIPVTISETGTATTFEAQLADVTLGRTLSAGVWSTLCLPFDVTTEAMQTATRATEVKMCTFDSYEDGTMTFKKTDEVTAGKPFLVKVNTTATNPTFLLVDVKNTEAKTEEHGDVSMVGCYGQTELDPDGEKEAVFLTASGTLKRPNSDSWTMKGLRAYFIVPKSFAGARVIIDDEEVTAIDAVLKPEPQSGGELYSLTGQRQTQSVRPGIYINNGKKVIIK